MDANLVLVPGDEVSNQVPLASLDILNWAPAKLTSSERLLLFSLIYSLRPDRYLEIGTYKGGSALIVGAAMDAADYPGRIICVDIAPQVDPAHWDMISHRAEMVVGNSRTVLSKAEDSAGGPFDFAFVDGDHREKSVIRDAEGVFSVLSPGGYILFHDAYHSPARLAVDEFAFLNRRNIFDFGNLTREYTIGKDAMGEASPFCGFRLVRRRPEKRSSGVNFRVKAWAKLFRRQLRVPS